MPGVMEPEIVFRSIKATQKDVDRNPKGCNVIVIMITIHVSVYFQVTPKQ